MGFGNASRTLCAFLTVFAAAAAPGVFNAVAPPRAVAASAVLGAPTDDIAQLMREERYLDAFQHSADRLARLTTDKGIDSPEIDDELARMGTCALRCGERPLAEAAYAMALARVRKRYADGDPHIAEALMRCANVARLVNEREKSWSLLKEAKAIIDGNDPAQLPLLAREKESEANLYRWQDQKLCLARYAEAIELRERSAASPCFETADDLAWYGWTLLHLGQHELGRQYMERARVQLEQLGLARHSLMGTIISAEADMRVLAGDWSGAEADYRRSTAIFERTRADRGELTTDLPLHGYNLLAMTQLEQGHPDDAWESLEHYRGQISGRVMALLSMETGSRPAFRQWASKHDALVRDTTLPLVLRTVDRPSPETWERFVRQAQLTARVDSEQSALIRAHPLERASLHELQGVLAPDEAYMGWLNADFANDMSRSKGTVLAVSWLYIIRHQGPIRWIRLWTAHTNEQRLRHSRPAASYVYACRRASEWRLHLEDDPDLARKAMQIGSSYVGTALDSLNGVKRVIVELQNRMPWIALEAMRDSNGRYLGERFDFSYVASAAVYQALMRREANENRDRDLSLLAVGDPIFRPSGDRSYPAHDNSCVDMSELRAALSGSPEALDRLPRLPFAADEMTQVAGRFENRTVLRGKNASESAINRLVGDDSLSDFDVVHVATHALSDPMYQRSALALSRLALGRDDDGLVSLSEIQAGWRLKADVVTLSCCQSAGTQWFRSDLLGFPHVLLSVGAQSVVASMWKVDDRATELLMTRFYDDLVADGGHGYRMATSDALEEAKNWLRDYTNEKGERPYRHPVYWSGFLLIGAPR